MRCRSDVDRCGELSDGTESMRSSTPKDLNGLVGDV